MAKKNPKNISWWNAGGIFAFLVPEFFRLDSVWDFINAIPILGGGFDWIMTHHISNWGFWLCGAVFLVLGFRRDYKNAKANKYEVPYGRWALIVVGISAVILMAVFCSPPTSKIPDINQFYENQHHYDDSKQLAFDGRAAFNSGDYAYAVYLLSKCESSAHDNPADSWQANKPLLYAAIFHQNPTDEGYSKFTNSLDNLVGQIKEQLDTTNGWFTNGFVLLDTQDQLKKVRRLLSSPSQKDYVQTNVIDRIDAIISSHPEIK